MTAGRFAAYLNLQKKSGRRGINKDASLRKMVTRE